MAYKTGATHYHAQLGQRSCNQIVGCLMDVTEPNTPGVWTEKGEIWLPLVVLGCWT